MWLVAVGNVVVAALQSCSVALLERQTQSLFAMLRTFVTLQVHCGARINRLLRCHTPTQEFAMASGT